MENENKSFVDLGQMNKEMKEKYGVDITLRKKQQETPKEVIKKDIKTTVKMPTDTKVPTSVKSSTRAKTSKKSNTTKKEEKWEPATVEESKIPKKEKKKISSRVKKAIIIGLIGTGAIAYKVGYNYGSYLGKDLQIKLEEKEREDEEMFGPDKSVKLIEPISQSTKTVSDGDEKEDGR